MLRRRYRVGDVVRPSAPAGGTEREARERPGTQGVPGRERAITRPERGHASPQRRVCDTRCVVVRPASMRTVPRYVE